MRTVAKGIVALLVVAGGLAACSEGNVFSLEEGDCFGDFSGGTVSDVDKVDCDEPHQNEVYAVFDSESDGDFPGEGDLSDEAEEECLGDRFEDYVGLSYDQSRYFASPIVPSEESWEESDDREIVCYLHEQDGSDIDGSVEGSEE
jgi:hypothetical protein